MAYRQKGQRPDIRALPISALPEHPTEQPGSAGTSHSHKSTMLDLHPANDLKRIALCSVPLIILLAVASYVESTRHWVIPFAHWLLRLGS